MAILVLNSSNRRTFSAADVLLFKSDSADTFTTQNMLLLGYSKQGKLQTVS